MQESRFGVERVKGIIFVLLSAVCFSTGGVLIKLIPWGSVTIQGIRSIFAFFVIALYMAACRHKFVCNKTVLFGALCNMVMSFTFVAATKLTTAANAIVLQFTEPIFVILLLWVIYRKKPGKDAVLACIVVFAGILCFFFESLSGGAMTGNLLAVFSGFTYALVMMMKGFPGADFESSLLISNACSAIVGLPFYVAETEHSLTIWGCMGLLGIVQFGFSYIFLSKGLDRVSPVTASLTSTIEPILNPLLVALFYGETIGSTAVIGAVLVVGASTAYNGFDGSERTKEQKESSEAGALT